MSVKIPTLEELMKAGAHFGHQTAKWHPKMEQYIFAEQHGVHVINLEETQKKLAEAVSYIEKSIAEKKILLFVGTKKQAQEITKKYATECGMPYINERWLGGTITNFANISKLIRKLINLKERKEKGDFKKYTKKEQLEFDREIERLEKFIGGMQSVKKVPDIIYVVDLKQEDTVIKEANKKKIPLVAICDTNTDPDSVDYPIPANDDAAKSIEIITAAIAEAVKEGKLQAEKAESVKKETANKEVKK